MTVIASSADDILTSAGDSLDLFRVTFHAEKVKRSTPKELAEAWIGFQLDLDRDIQPRFARLTRAAHLKIVSQYYVPELLAQQQAAYDAEPPRETKLRLTLGEIKKQGSDGATVNVQRTSVQNRDGKLVEKSFALRLQLGRYPDGWRLLLVQIWNKKTGEFQANKFQVRPKLTRSTVLPSAPADRTSPVRLLTSLQTEVKRFGALRRNGQDSLNKNFLAVVEAFYSESMLKRARDMQTADREKPPLRRRFNKPQAAGKEMVVESDVLEADKESAVAGHLRHRMRIAKVGGWLISEEWVEVEGRFVSSKSLGICFLE